MQFMLSSSKFTNITTSKKREYLILCMISTANMFFLKHHPLQHNNIWCIQSCINKVNDTWETHVAHFWNCWSLIFYFYLIEYKTIRLFVILSFIIKRKQDIYIIRRNDNFLDKSGLRMMWNCIPQSVTSSCNPVNASDQRR